MFLLGISGSLLPYLLLLGVVLVFSCQTTAQTMNDARNSDENNARKHLYFEYHPSKDLTDRNYYFSADNTGKQSNECCDSKLKEQLSATRIKIIFVPSITDFFTWKKTTINQLSSFIFSGLSPPFSSLQIRTLI